MITTTLNRIREHSPCATGWGKLLRHLGKTRRWHSLMQRAEHVRGWWHAEVP